MNMGAIAYLCGTILNVDIISSRTAAPRARSCAGSPNLGVGLAGGGSVLPTRWPSFSMLTLSESEGGPEGMRSSI